MMALYLEDGIIFRRDNISLFCTYFLAVWENASQIRDALSFEKKGASTSPGKNESIFECYNTQMTHLTNLCYLPIGTLVCGPPKLWGVGKELERRLALKVVWTLSEGF